MLRLTLHFSMGFIMKRNHVVFWDTAEFGA